jgi:hypothetical protein
MFVHLSSGSSVLWPSWEKQAIRAGMEIISKEKCNTERIFIEGSPHTAVCMQG